MNMPPRKLHEVQHHPQTGTLLPDPIPEDEVKARASLVCREFQCRHHCDDLYRLVTVIRLETRDGRLPVRLFRVR
jgi:hypothetical protein